MINLSDRPQVYGGFRYDVTEVGNGLGPCSGPGPLLCPDVPFSLALDTAILPFTAIYELFFSR